MPESPRSSAVLLAGTALIAAALAAAGYFVGHGAARFRSEVRSVTVKGLVEREVKADHAEWTLWFRRAGNTLAEQHAAIAAGRDAVIQFLRARGFAEGDIHMQPTRIQDRLAQDFGGNENRANPRYVVSTFNELRPGLLAAATANARAIATQFAGDSGASVGGIRSANQGNIQIFGSDGNDESAPYSPTSTPVKKIRVVSTFDFELR